MKYFSVLSLLLLILFSSVAQANIQSTQDIFTHSHKFIIKKLEHYENGISAADVTDNLYQTYQRNTFEGQLYFLTENINDWEVGQQLGVLGMYELLDSDNRPPQNWADWAKELALLGGVGHFLTTQGKMVTAVYSFPLILRNGVTSKEYSKKTISITIPYLKKSSFYEVLLDASDSIINPQLVWTKNLGDNNAYILSYGRELWVDTCDGECPLQCINCPLPIISAKKSDILEIEEGKGCLNLQTGIYLSPSPDIHTPNLVLLMQNFPLDIIKNELTRKSKGGIQYHYLEEFVSQYGDYFDVSDHEIGELLFYQ